VTEVLLPFAGVLRGLRTEAGLTQEELAEAAGLSSRAISYLERGEVGTPRKETVRLLADALQLTGPARAQFETAARNRGRAGDDGTARAARTLPRDIGSFTGRERELAELVATAASASAVVSIHAIGGMAGVGKTVFAVHAAHRLADRFPGGHIFLPLHGHTPGHRPTDPADALASLLAAIGVPAAQIPASLEARTSLWRDRAAGQQLLLILDDAISSEQVRPLIPGSGGTLVLITSRRHLSALDDATPVSLDTLPPGQAAVLLTRLAGRPALNPDDPAVGELTRLCGFLPLAIGMVARQLRHHPSWTPAGRAAELAAAADRLDAMATENLSVAAAFDLSYADLTGDQQRLFRRLAMHPGAEIDGYAGAALDGTDLPAARRGLEDLYDHHLLTEPAAGRYRLHDLIRAHARTLAGLRDPDHDRDQATERLLDYYEHTAAGANALIARARPVPAGANQATPTAVPALADLNHALAWLRAERASLLACLDLATRTGQHAHVVSLTAGLSELWQRDGPWTEAITQHIAAIAAAQQLGDRLGHANALNDLGIMRRLTGDYPAAVQAHQQALDIYRDLGHRPGEANGLSSLAVVLYLTGYYPAAAQALERAVHIYRQSGDQLGEADVLNRLGDVLQQISDFPAAAQDLERALGIYRDLGHRPGEANALSSLAVVLDLTGHYAEAVQAHEQALDIYRGLGHRLGEANALYALARVLRRMGDYSGAFKADEDALGIYRQIGSRLGEANALDCLGAALRLMGDYPAAAQALDRALGIHRQLGHRDGQAEALNEQGALHRVSGEVALAERCHLESLQLARATGNPWNEAHALAGLGRCALAGGDTAEGEARLRQALTIFQRSDAAAGADISAELDALSGPA
jgi:tetratricopeptide (TPR) repeat protein/transcriptional regulator with XRE-family HTH domain